MSNQERRLMRRMAGRSGQYPTGPAGLFLPQGAYSPQDEQDAKRDRLAEQVLLEMVAYVEWGGGGEDKDLSAERAEAEEALRTAAHAALAAAEVVYPELPEPGTAEVSALQFGDALKIAQGCFDYGGGYHDPAQREIFHHGIGTVVNALTAATAQGLKDTQIAVLHSIGSQPLPAAAQVGAESVFADAVLTDHQRTIMEGCWLMGPEEYSRRLAAGEVGGRKVVIDPEAEAAQSVGGFPVEERSPVAGTKSFEQVLERGVPPGQPYQPADRGEG